MSILTNKHVVVALIVAPILAILSYFAVDFLVAEQPHQAKSGATYELIEQSNCRYSSGNCELKNGNFSLHLKANWDKPDALTLQLDSRHALEGVKIAALASNGREAQPQAMQALDTDGKQWTITLPTVQPGEDRLRLVASAQDSLYYADASTIFSHYETSFQQDFR